MISRLTQEQAEAHIHGVCFKTGPPGRVGVELEWLVHERADPRAIVPVERVDEVLGPFRSQGLPRGGRLTVEPGGQVELSSQPADLPAAIEAAAADATALRRAFSDAGLVLSGLGLDPDRASPRILDHPRYRAMEAYFDRFGPSGRMMMRSTAAVQVNLDVGDATDRMSGYRRRWELVHRIGPVLVAAFANSPLWQGRPTGWRSTRQRVWSHLDPCRTRPPRHDRVGGPRISWARYALDAPLLCIRGDSHDWRPPPGVTFRGWLGQHDLRPPTLDDLDYHLSTLFPPVRPRGWLELRMVDAQPGDDWIAPATLAATLLDDPDAADAAYEATEPLCTGPTEMPPPAVWTRAARTALADPVLAKAARVCFAVADSVLARDPAAASARRALADFADRYPERGRCPADDTLDALTGRGPSPQAVPTEGTAS